MRRRSAATARPAVPTASAAIDWRVCAGAALIVVATVAVYWPSLRGPFIFDDLLLLTDNALIKAADGPYRFWFSTEAIDYWPVTNTWLWVEWRLWGMDSTGYHVAGLVLHLVEVMLVWRILALLAVPGAGLAALLFAVHPVNVETIAWIAQRKSQLAALFVLLSALAFLYAEAPPPLSRASRPVANRWYWISLAGCALAMLSKVSAAVLPPLLLALVWWVRPVTRRDLARLVPFVAVVAALIAVNLWFRSRGLATAAAAGGATPLERLLGAPAVVWFYLSKALLPLDLALIYPEWRVAAADWRWWVPLLAFALVSAVLWRFRRRWSRAPLFAWIAFCVALLPVMGFTDVGFQQHIVLADHYQHLALIAVVALAGAGWAAWRRRAGRGRRLADAAALGAAAALALLAWRQAGLYADGIALYTDTVAKSPDAWMAHNNLGGLLFDAGRLDEAMAHDLRALELRPDYAEAHNNLANVLQRTGRRAEAIAHYRRALELKPRYAIAHNNLAAALAADGRFDEAIAHFERALELKPDYPEARANLEVARGLKAAAP